MGGVDFSATHEYDLAGRGVADGVGRAGVGADATLAR